MSLEAAKRVKAWRSFGVAGRDVVHSPMSGTLACDVEDDGDVAPKPNEEKTEGKGNGLRSTIWNVVIRLGLDGKTTKCGGTHFRK
jgi:hypothetical protein